jgi:hypothetical protein
MLFTFSKFKAQLHQTIGLGYGLTYGGYAISNKDPLRQDIVLRYNLKYIRFLVKAGVGIRPNTYFGTQYTGTLQLGYTMPIYKTLSFFVTTGILGTNANQPKRTDLKYAGSTVSGSLGIHVRPINKQPWIIGLEAISFQEFVSYNIRGWGYTSSNWPLTTVLSVNYLISKAE